jgi:hypothetical protein
MASQLASDIIEIDGINKELSVIRNRSKALREKKEEIETRLAKYFEKTKDPGLKYKGKEVRPKEKNLRTRKNKTERVESVKEALKESGYDGDVDALAHKILANMRGVQYTVPTIVVKDKKK